MNYRLEIIFIVVALLSYCEPLQAQNNSIRIKVIYAAFELREMKNFQLEQHQQALKALNVQAQIKEDFPDNIGYELDFKRHLGKTQLGIEIGYNSTGSRITYSDYSGTFRLDNLIDSWNFGIISEMKVKHFEFFDLMLSCSAGIGLTNLDINYRLLVDGLDYEGIDQSFQSLNFYVSPSASLRIPVNSRLFVDANFEFYLDIPGELKYEKDNDYYLTFESGKKVAANWSGFRMGVGLGYTF